MANLVKLPPETRCQIIRSTAYTPEEIGDIRLTSSTLREDVDNCLEKMAGTEPVLASFVLQFPRIRQIEPEIIVNRPDEFFDLLQLPQLQIATFNLNGIYQVLFANWQSQVPLGEYLGIPFEYQGINLSLDYLDRFIIAGLQLYFQRNRDNFRLRFVWSLEILISPEKVCLTSIEPGNPLFDPNNFWQMIQPQVVVADANYLPTHPTVRSLDVVINPDLELYSPGGQNYYLLNYGAILTYYQQLQHFGIYILPIYRQLFDNLLVAENPLDLVSQPLPNLRSLDYPLQISSLPQLVELMPSVRDPLIYPISQPLTPTEVTIIRGYRNYFEEFRLIPNYPYNSNFLNLIGEKAVDDYTSSFVQYPC